MQILEGKEERTDEEEGKYDEGRGSGENSGLLGFIESVPTPNGRKKARKREEKRDLENTRTLSGAKSGLVEYYD